MTHGSLADAVDGRSARLRVLPAGDRALLLEPDDPATLPGLVDALRTHAPEGVRDILPAARTVLVTVAPGALARVADRLRSLTPAADSAGARSGELVVPVRYDGADLAEVAALLRISPAEVIERHTGAQWRCAFVGFAPGFGYLEAPDAGLAVPRRSQARTRVPAGAVALAAGYSAVYPRSSPGGWQVIGSTDLVFWDVDRPQPALVRPGTRVRFVEESAR
ncbi:5-oxoprolinase subunit B family protein [Nocardia stercoris]|uniref:Allophanate hydrolase subunit 1 n=1 Tax=Nocardia stercoris TaxID=2483361 RepID=A0A3M2L416_9NOCA|nr:allophanate hydrolase subunit 1 [Nocardia stercoris]RMI32301.1 allophanate hydrolase subunit 1 [Nocardia stercoris]